MNSVDTKWFEATSTSRPTWIRSARSFNSMFSHHLIPKPPKTRNKLHNNLVFSLWKARRQWS